MPYMIETWDKDGAQALRLKLRPLHLEYLETIGNKLMACGAKISDDESTASGGLYVVDVETRSEAEDLINNDPFSKGDLFRAVTITRWRKAYFDGVNCL
jgi:uncharacterized protein YciI